VYILIIILLMCIFVLIFVTVATFIIAKMPWYQAAKFKWPMIIVFGFVILRLPVDFLIKLQESKKEQPLPSDQEMIDHFYAHKEEFEKLAESAREYDEHWENRPEVLEWREKSGIDVIIGGSGYPWDDPRARIRENKPEDYVPGYFVHPINARIANHKHIRDTLVIKMKDRERYYQNYIFNGDLNWKDYIYFKKERVINEYGKIKWRTTKHPQDYGGPQYHVLPSLDNIKQFRIWHPVKKMYSPTHPKWDATVCVVRPVTPHWFLRRCRRD